MTANDDVLAAVGPRLRALRHDRGVTLAALSETTGISVSTLSRLESGNRRATLELLLPLARAYRVPLDDLVGAPATGDPRVHIRPITRHGQTIVPLTRQPGGLQAFKHVIPAGPVQRPDPRTHEGYEWLYVLAGRLRLVLGEHDIVLPPGEAAEFDTRVPHWFGRSDREPVELLSIFGPQGERVHVRARSAARQSAQAADGARNSVQRQEGARQSVLAPEEARQSVQRPKGAQQPVLAPEGARRSTDAPASRRAPAR